MNASSIQLALDELSNLGVVEEFQAGELLIRNAEPDHSLVLIVEGELESFSFNEDLQTQRHLQTMLVGEIASLPINESSGSRLLVRATQKSRVCRLPVELQQELSNGQHPAAKHYMALLQHTLLSQAQKTLHVNPENEQHSPVVDAFVRRSLIAQSSLQHWPEDRIDELIGDIADAVNRQAWMLAEAAISETGMGVVAHRVQKILLGTMEIAASLRGQPGSGSLAIESPGVDTITVPMGVILGLIPVTNPVETLVFKVLIALKSRNSVILSCHRKARQVSLQTVQIIRDVLARHEMNPDLVQTPDLPPTRELTSLLMSHPDVSFILATGGTNMVRSAYRSGTPSIGVGKGNAPVWICADANLERVAEQIVTSKAFDNGVVCGSENNLLVDHEIVQAFAQSLCDAGAAVLNPSETLSLLRVIFTEGKLGEQWLGKSAQHICQAAGISRPNRIELIVVPQMVTQLDSPLFREKLAPIVSMVTIRGEQQALATTRTILSHEGRGHTAIIHTHDRAKVDAFAKAADVCRVLVNSPGTQGCIGACNGLELSWTLGCGTAGGSSTSDNVTYRHLQNIKRIAHAKTEIKQANAEIRKLG